jgi:molecular chaperone DnaJ
LAKPRDYYEVLGVSRDADEGELKRAYRALALRYHPDHNQNDKAAEEKFKEVSAAYAVLSDPEKRLRYNRLGHLGLTPAGAGADAVSLDLDNVKEFFDSIFGDIGDLLGRKKGRSGGRDLRYTVEISLREAVLGAQKSISFPVRGDCSTCQGSGARGGEAGLRVCRTCSGKGELRAPGFLPIRRPCTPCRGTGKEVVDACPSCRGNGQTERQREFVVNVPAGCEDGTTRRLAGQGEPGRQGGNSGDLTVVLRIKPHPLIRREGALLHCDVPLTLIEAALGAEIEVPTIDGNVEMKVPAGTQSGTVFRLRGKGVLAPSGQRGDLHVRVVVETPKSLDDRSRLALLELASKLPAGSHPQKQQFAAALLQIEKDEAPTALTAEKAKKR